VSIIQPLLCFVVGIALIGCGGQNRRSDTDGGLPSVASQARQGSWAAADGVLQSRCVSCHSPASSQAGLVLDGWAGVLAGSDDGEAVIPFDAKNSLLVEMLTKRVGGAHPTELGVPGATPAEVTTLAAWVDEGAVDPDGKMAFPPTGERIYLANQASALISVIDAEAGVVIRTVDVTDYGFDANSRPHHTVADPNGAHWYVSLIGGGHVLRFTRDGELVGRAPFEAPGMLAISGGDDRLYVGRSMMAVSPPQRVGVIERTSMDIEEMDVFFQRPHALIVDAKRGRFFTASLAENRVAVVDTQSEDVELVDLPGPPHTLVQFALSPDGERLVATAQLTGKLLVFDATQEDLPLLTEIDVGRQPWHPTYSPDGGRVFFGVKDDNAVVVVETKNWTVEKRIQAPGISEPHGSAITSDGRFLFVSNRNQRGAYKPRHDLGDNEFIGTVVKIDTQTLEVVKTIEVEKYPAGISVGRGS